MTSPASKEWPCCFLRSLGPIPALPPVAVWPRVNYCTSGLICKVGGGEHTQRRKATRSKEAKRKLQVKKAKDWLEAQRLTGGQVALWRGEGGQVRRRRSPPGLSRTTPEAAPGNRGPAPGESVSAKANQEPGERAQASPAPLSQVGWS